MKISRTSTALGVVAALACAAAWPPALGQDSPESLLPPGFDDPVEPAPAATPSPTPGQPAPLLPPGRPGDSPGDLLAETDTSNDTDAEALEPEPLTPAELARYELPKFARRSLDRVGFVASSKGGVGADAFGRSDGRFLEGLMRRLDAPIASRWLSIALRRVLVSELDTPPRVNGADFAAERAWLLLRMGEANAARATVQSVDTIDYTPKLRQIALQAALATGDPAMVCPSVAQGIEDAREKGWQLAEAMCAALAGEPSEAGRLLDAARRRGAARGIDFLLAEKVVGAGAQGRRAVTLEWENVDRLTAWRWGLAAAMGEAAPDRLLDGAGSQVRMWQALAPAIAPASRLPSAELAAARGVLDGASYRDLLGSVGEDEVNDRAIANTITALTDAFVAQDLDSRMAALRQLWRAETPLQRYARFVLTSDAAARIPPSEAYAEDTDGLVASMLATGKDLRALRWRALVPDGGRAWAMLALADPRGSISVAPADVTGFGDGEREAALLFAGLAGLGRLPEGQVPELAQTLNVPINLDNPWAEAIRAAANRGERGTVVLLAAIGMQTPDWRGISPAALFTIVAALDAVGLNGEARMIAAEAIARA